MMKSLFMLVASCLMLGIMSGAHASAWSKGGLLSADQIKQLEEQMQKSGKDKV